MTDDSESRLLSPDGFSAAIEAAGAAAHAGADDQEQLAAGIVAYCSFMQNSGSSLYILQPVCGLGRSSATEIGVSHSEKDK